MQYQLTWKMIKVTLLGVQIVTILNAFTYCITSSTSNFYQPGHGILTEWWLTNHTWKSYNSSYLLKLTRDNPDYKQCPLFTANADSFEHTFTDKGRLQYGRYRAYFIPLQTGEHRFFAICNSRCEIYLRRPPIGSQKILYAENGTGDNWSERRISGYQHLIKGFGYFIDVIHHAYGDKKGFFRLGVILPNSQEVKPISKQYLWRSMRFYKWSGLLVEKYDSMNFSSWQSYSISNVISMSADKYPDHPSSYHCKSSLYDESPNGFFGNNYALRYTGYIKPTYTSQFNMHMYCDEMCQFNLTGLSPKQFLIRNYATPGSVVIGETKLSQSTHYPIKIFMAEANDSGYLRVTYQEGGRAVEKSWKGFLHNLNTDESITIPKPHAQAKNQTCIKVTLRSPPSLPSEDNWEHAERYDLFYRQKGSYTKVELNGSLPVSFDLTGLRKFTDYFFYAHYYGASNISTTLNLISSLTSTRTAEDVPGKPPARLSGSAASSSRIQMTWDAVPSEFQYGKIRGYNIYFKTSSNNAWGGPITTIYRTYSFSGLHYWTYYDVKISAFTAPGEGPNSSVITVRTAEHSPTAAPASFMEYEITDLTIALKWEEIPLEYRNGILTGYSILFKKTTARIWQEIEVPAGKTSWTVDALEHATAYEFEIAGKTVAGTGIYTDVVIVKTEVGRLMEAMSTAYFTSLDFTDKVLTKHISKTIQVTTIEQCFRTCLDCIKPNSGCSCSSFNIKRPSSSSASFTCEINDSDQDACPLDFVKERGYQYYQIR